MRKRAQPLDPLLQREEQDRAEPDDAALAVRRCGEGPQRSLRAHALLQPEREVAGMPRNRGQDSGLGILQSVVPFTLTLDPKPRDRVGDALAGAWISTSGGRGPPGGRGRQEPATSPECCDRKIADGLETPRRPLSVIANTPSSFTAPKRFLKARMSRKLWCVSPSKYSTASTICSTTRGPAIAPSLVTWPTSTTTAPLAFA